MGSNNSKDLLYSVPLENSKQNEFSAIYRHPEYTKGLTSTPFPQIQTYRDVLERSCLQKFPNNKCAGKINLTKETKDGETVEHRAIEYLTYRQAFDKANLLGRGILGQKLQFAEKTAGMNFVGIFSKNRVEWLITDFACTLFGITTIPLYDTLGIENLSYCLNQTELTTLFLTADTLKILLDLKDKGNVKNLVLFDRIDKQHVDRANSMKLNVIDFNALIEEGKKYDIDYKQIPVTPEMIHTFSYTSGTTGPPKGAMLCHRNFTAFLAAFMANPARFNESDVYLSFLPLPHVMERVILTSNILVGSEIVFYSGDMLKIKDDCQVVKPTVFVAVPRLYNRIVEKVEEGFNEATGVKRCLLDSGVNSKMDAMKQNGEYKSGFYDSIVFSKVKQKFGGRIREMITGSAPITKKTFEFMQMIMSAPMYEGYGQTENTAAAFIRSELDPVSGHVGGVVSSLEFKLNDIPEMRYTSEDKDANGKPTPRGEIWLRGPAVFSGYYKLKDKTNEAITSDGWLKTGDVGELVAGSNAMKIVDRRKNIFKLQQGEYVAPEKVQIIYGKCPYVEEVFLHGESTHNYCVAVVKPHQDHFLELAKKHNVPGDYNALCSNPEMRRLLVKEMFAQGKAAGLYTFEQAKNIYIEPRNFADKKILTNTMKLQRFEARVQYKPEIEKMYTEGELPVK